MAKPWMTRELAGLDIGLTSVDINSGYATHSESRNKSQIPDAAREDNVPSTQAPYNETDTFFDLHSLPRDNSDMISLSYVGQNSARMQLFSANLTYRDITKKLCLKVFMIFAQK